MITSQELNLSPNNPRQDCSPVILSSIRQHSHIFFNEEGSYYFSPLELPNGLSYKISGLCGFYTSRSRSATQFRPFAPQQKYIIKTSDNSTPNEGRQVSFQHICFIGIINTLLQENSPIDGLIISGGDNVCVQNCGFHRLRHGIYHELTTSRIICASINDCSFPENTVAIFINITQNGSFASLIIQNANITKGKVAILAKGYGHGGFNLIGGRLEAQSIAGIILDQSTCNMIGTYLEHEPLKTNPSLFLTNGSYSSILGGRIGPVYNHNHPIANSSFEKLTSYTKQSQPIISFPESPALKNLLNEYAISL